MESVETHVSPAQARCAWWRLAIALVPAYPLIVLLADSRALAGLKVETALVLLVTTLRPSAGLVTITALAPLGDMLIPLLGGRPIAHAETIVLAFLTAWLTSTAVDRRTRQSVTPIQALAMWTFGAIVLASVGGTALNLYHVRPEDFGQVMRSLADGYLNTADPIGVHAAANLLEGLAILVAAAELVRDEPRLRASLNVALVSAAIAGVAGSALLANGIAPAATRLRLALSELPRYSATVADVNAAASWYVLLAGVAGGIAASRRGIARGAWAGAVAVLYLGIWLTGSRAGIAAGGALVCGAVALRIVHSGRRIAGALAAAVIVAGLIAIVALAATRSSESSLGMRAGFTEASYRMIDARPAFGVGVGRYYALSELVMPPPLAWFYGRENAHDYYLQTIAELGIVGGLAFIAVFATALATPLGIAWRDRDATVTAGLVGGTLAYLTTSLTGHPFLTFDTAVPFWLTLGMLATCVTPTRHRSVHVAGALVAAALLVTVPLRPAVPRLALNEGEDGLGPVQVDDHGAAFREGGPFVSVFVGSRATGVRIPLRLAASTPLEAVSTGIAATKGPTYPVMIGHQWFDLDVALPGADPLIRAQRINIRMFPPSTGPHDLRIDVGPITIRSTR